jgi:hypothetical protein
VRIPWRKTPTRTKLIRSKRELGQIDAGKRIACVSFRVLYNSFFVQQTSLGEQCVGS